MPADENSSLFSIELVVDRVGSLDVPCRLPVIAFRLLDLPTVVIHAVSPQQVDSLRQHVQLGSFRAPLQLVELQDHRGNFVFGKGKSCLFKMNFNVLCRHLHATPLYLMLLDVWSSPAHLIGSTSIRLDAVADDLLKCREENGDGSPGVSGGRGKFPVFNLMGSRVATVDVRYRMYSLGPALATHLQVVRDERGTESKTAGDTTLTRQEREMQTVSVQAEDMMVGSVVPADEATDVECEVKLHSSRMTTSQREEQHHPNHTKVEEQVYITNTVCPPALFYNSEAADVTPPFQHDVKTIESDEEDIVSCSDSIVDQSWASAVSGPEEDHWRNVVASEPNNVPLQATSIKRAAQEETTDLLDNSENDAITTHDDRNQERVAPHDGRSEFSLLFGLLSELSQLLGNQAIPSRTQRQTNASRQSADHQPGRQTHTNLQELASLVYQRLTIQKMRDGPLESQKKTKTMATTTRQSHSVDTMTKGLCAKVFATHSPPRPYRNLTHFARFPKKANSTQRVKTEIPFSKPRQRHSEMMTKHQGVRKKETPKKKLYKETKKPQIDQPHKNSTCSKESEGELAESASRRSGSVHHHTNSIEVHLPNVTCGDDIITEGIPDTQDDEVSQDALELGVKLVISSHSEQQDVAAVFKENQPLHVEDLKSHSLSPLSTNEQSQQPQVSGSKERLQESDQQSDVYSEQFEYESHNTSIASSRSSQNTRQIKTGSSKRSSRSSRHRASSSSSSSGSSSSGSSSSRSSPSSRTSTQHSVSSRDSAMPRIASMTNLKAIESNLGYTI